MRRAFVALLFAAAGAIAGASAGAQAAPSTDIFLAPLTVTADGPIFGPFVNITNRPGYDNQPSFTPNGRSILFTSVRRDGQSDIYRYDIASKQTARVTTTPESEYSAIVMPGGKRFSVVRVEKDSTQRLWSFALDGSDPKLLVHQLRPVGYQTWIDRDNLALFVLGQPNALVHANLRTGELDTLARDIGRSLLPLPDKSGFSFVQRLDDTTFVLKAMSWPSRSTRTLTTLPHGTEDVAWVNINTVLAGRGTKLLIWKRGAIGWRTLRDLGDAGLTNITRLAVSPDRKWLAVVAMPRL